MKTIELEYEINPQRRHGGLANPHLHRIINQRREAYAIHLQYFASIRDEFIGIENEPYSPVQSAPHWNNGFLPGLDIVALHGLLRRLKPRVYLEIGSGNSTKVARRCISMHGLETEIVSIDPFPRAEIDSLCDTVIRSSLQDIDLDPLTQLEPGDFLFIDGSHHTFMNSDTMVLFLEVLPVLKPGVLVQIHDICLPYDYPESWAWRCYSEQYMLASALLFGPERFVIEVPNMFISQDPELSALNENLWDHPRLRDVQHRHGASFWFTTRM